MRASWHCSGFVGLLTLVSAMTQRGELAAVDDGAWGVFWVEKSVNVLELVKRKDACAVAGWSLCPASAGGGCCPGGFACDTASCYATTASLPTCNGLVGYHACPLTAGPGSCCPVGTACGEGNSCEPPDGSSPVCPSSFTGCPASLGGGCCGEDMVCGVGICHSTSPRTELVTAVMTTTDSRGHTTVTVATSTTILVDGPNTSSTASGVSAVAQFVPSTVSKLPAIHTSDGGSGGGLSSGALGGIVAGVIVLLVAVIAAAVLIVMRLKNAERAAKAAEVAAESRHESSNGRSRSRKTGFGQPSVSEIDSATDIDPSHQFPIMRPSPRTLTLSTPSLSNDRSTPNFLNSGTSSPPIWGVPFSSNYVPSEASDGRQSSLDSYAHRDFNNVSRLSERVSLDSHGPTPTAAYGHSRQPSDTSELEGPHGVSELETYDESRRRSNSATRPAKAHVRLTSDPSRNRGDSNAAAVVAGSLGTVNEMHELHGHYGPPIGWQNKLRDN